MQKHADKDIDLNDPLVVSCLDEIPFWSAPFALRLLDMIDYKAGITALDIGCGTGFTLLELAMRLGSSTKAYGLDPWDAALDRVRQKIGYNELNNVEVFSGVAEAMPFPDDNFDLIISNNGLNNVEDLGRAVEETGRVAKKGAQLLFSFNLSNTMKEFYGVYLSVLKDRNMTGEITRLEEHIYSKRRPVEEIESLFVKHGFEVRRLEYDSFSFKYLDGTSMLSHYMIKIGFKKSWKEVCNYDQDVLWEVEKRLNETASEQGFLKLSIPFAVLEAYKI